MSKWFTVNVKIEREADFEITLEADSEEEAKDEVQTRFWKDEYTREERACSTVTDENYSVEEEIDDCEDCGEPKEECTCEVAQ